MVELISEQAFATGEANGERRKSFCGRGSENEKNALPHVRIELTPSA
jgi:hypothetical protein